MRIVSRLVSKGKLQDPHSRKAPALAQRVDLRCDISEIFGDSGQLSEGFLQQFKKTIAGSRSPATIDSGGGIAGDLPVFFETAKVVQANHIDHL